MKLLKWLGGIFSGYVIFVVLFESAPLGVFQPDFAGTR